MNMRRGGHTLLELVIVLTLSMALLVSVTSAMGMVPVWFLALQNRVDLLREAHVARCFLLKDLQDAKEVPNCLASTFQIELASTGDTITYEAVTNPNSSDVKDLYRRVNGVGNVRVATFVSSMTCVNDPLPPAQAKRADLCLVFKKGNAVRRTTVSCLSP